MTTIAEKPASDTAAKRYATKDFSDAGTERAFKLNDVVDVDAATLANYEAAGLVGATKTKAADAA